MFGKLVAVPRKMLTVGKEYNFNGSFKGSESPLSTISNVFDMCLKMLHFMKTI
jgi:hypothetical protein